MVCRIYGHGTARSISWATPSAYNKKNGGESNQTVGMSSHHYEVTDLRPDAVQGSRWGRENTYSVPDCINFTTWNIGTMTGRSGEVVETLYGRKIDVCCVQETRRKGSAASIEWRKKLQYKLFWQGCRDNNAAVGLLISGKWIDIDVDVKRVY